VPALPTTSAGWFCSNRDCMDCNRLFQLSLIMNHILDSPGSSIQLFFSWLSGRQARSLYTQGGGPGELPDYNVKFNFWPSPKIEI